MGHSASVEMPHAVVTSMTPGVTTRSVSLKGIPTLMVPYPRRGTFFICFAASARLVSSGDKSAFSIWTTSKFRIRGGIEFRGHSGPVTGAAVLTSELHEFELTSRMCVDDEDPCNALADPVTACEELLVSTSLDGYLRIFDLCTQACVCSIDLGEPLIGLALWPPTTVRQGLLKELGAIAGRAVAIVATKSGNVVPLRIAYRQGVVTLKRLVCQGNIPPFDDFGHSLSSVTTSMAQSPSEWKDISFLIANPSGVSIYRVVNRTAQDPNPEHVAASLLEDVPLAFRHIATQPLPAFRNALTGAAFRTVHDSSQFVACGYDRVVMYETETFAPLWTALGHRAMITTLGTSIDGRRVISGDLEGVLNVWDCASGTHQQEIHGAHTTSVRNIYFLADDRFVLSTAVGEKQVVRTIPVPDARHVVTDSVDVNVLPKEVSAWLVAQYLSPGDIRPLSSP